MSKTAVIIPCYNEAKRLRADLFTTFLSDNADTEMFFINDGSTDGTDLILGKLSEAFPSQVSVINFIRNKGKACAVRQGFQEAASRNIYTYIGYLDADLSTSLKQFNNLCTTLAESNADFIFGSRIKMLESNIQRSFYRHLCGRLIATIIDMKLKLGVYDTQCGAKLFKTALVKAFAEEPFKTKWLFDVEIFMRINKLFPLSQGIEKPLKEWKDAGDSKIGASDFIGVCRDIMTVYKLHKSSI